MSDDLSKKGPADANKVNVNESWEVTYWCKKWGCTESELKAAVKAAGSTVATKVKEALDKAKKP